jgi:hypothetical protein
VALALCFAVLGSSLEAGGVANSRSNRRSDCGAAKSTPVPSFPFNPFLLSELSPPVIEPAGSWLATLQTTGRGPGVAYLIGARRPGYMPMQGGMLLVDLSDARVLQTVRFNRGQKVFFSLPIPDQERLCSQRIRVQAVIVDPSGTYLTNAFDLTLGR